MLLCSYIYMVIYSADATQNQLKQKEIIKLYGGFFVV
jgi:hypothetical protein